MNRRWLARTTDTRPDIGEREAEEVRRYNHPLAIPARPDDFWLIDPQAGQAWGGYPSYTAAHQDLQPGQFVAVRVVLK